MDSSPFEGAGRVEDTLNILGHAARNLLRVAARLTGRSAAEIGREAGLNVLVATSIKRGLDRQWHEVGAMVGALVV